MIDLLESCRSLAQTAASGQYVGRVRAEQVRDALDRAINVELDRRTQAEERQIVGLLGRWVSECEPSVLRGPDLQIIGLTLAGLPLGSKAPVVVPL